MNIQTGLLLIGAILAEVAGTLSLKFSEGFSRLVPSLIVLIGYGLSFYLLSLVLKRGLEIGLVYAIWAGLGTAAIAVAGVILFEDQLKAPAILGIILIIAGVVLVNLYSTAK
jgi:small multidrug resistance pump